MNLDTTEQIQNSALKIRGYMLNELIFIERLIDEYITRHFCKDEHKKKELFEFIVCEYVAFEPKRHLLNYLIEKYDKELFENNESNLKDLTDLMVKRNRFAHWMVDTSEEAHDLFKQNKIRLTRFKNKTEHYIITDKIIEELGVKIKNCRDMMAELLEKTNPTPSN
jgi:hypothetical protein